MTPQEIIHIKAAKYANTCKEQFLQKVKEGVIEPRTKKMEGWIWMAHYEGYRDALQEQLMEPKEKYTWGTPLLDAALLAPEPGQLKDRGKK
jgi:spore maturation protein CgeB